MSKAAAQNSESTWQGSPADYAGMSERSQPRAVLQGNEQDTKSADYRQTADDAAELERIGPQPRHEHENSQQASLARGRTASRGCKLEGLLQKVIGLHMGFGEMMWPSLQEIAALARTRPRPGLVVAVGDYNIDLTARVMSPCDGVSAHAAMETASEATAAIDSLAKALAMRI